MEDDIEDAQVVELVEEPVHEETVVSETIAASHATPLQPVAPVRDIKLGKKKKNSVNQKTFVEWPWWGEGETSEDNRSNECECIDCLMGPVSQKETR